MNHRANSMKSLRAQNGVALVVALIMLVLITLLGVAATQSSLLGGKVARNERERQIAFAGAQAALEDAALEMRSGVRTKYFTEVGTSESNVFDTGCTTLASATGPGLCAPSEPFDTANPVWLTVDFGPASVRAVRYGWYTGAAFASREKAPVRPGNAAPQLAADPTVGAQLPALHPRYIIERVEEKQVGGGADTGAGPGPALAYRITAVGYGLNENVQVAMQAIYRSRLESPP